MIKEKCEKLASIIGNFRSGEIEQIGIERVEKWLSQFDEDKQEPIIEEMIYVFSDWYLSQEYIINEYLDKIPGILQEKYGFSSEAETCKNVVFVDMQAVGASQRMLVSELGKLKKEQYGITIKSEIDPSVSHYAYIDDGFYSGSRARKDIKELVYQLKSGDTLDVFYLVMCTGGLLYAKKEFKELEAECKVTIKFHPLAKIDNDRKEHTEYKDGTEKVWWMNNQMCLWPSAASGKDPEVSTYYDYLKTVGTNYEKIPYRNSHWVNDPGVFSSSERRALIEHEFLKKGIMIAGSYRREYGNSKGMYPLGYNLWPSFGFGVMFATDYNVPNNAPLVLWADTDWYPLLPRRKNTENDVTEVDTFIDFESESQRNDQYNMCPDCGKFFGFDEDGGNGFCIDCAWNH